MTILMMLLGEVVWPDPVAYVCSEDMLGCIGTTMILYGLTWMLVPTLAGIKVMAKVASLESTVESGV